MKPTKSTDSLRTIGEATQAGTEDHAPQRALLVVATSLMVFPTAGVEILGVVMAAGIFGSMRVQRATA